MLKEYKEPYEVIRVIELEKRYRLIVKNIYSNEYDIAEITKREVEEVNQETHPNPFKRYKDVSDFCLVGLCIYNRKKDGTLKIPNPFVIRLRDDDYD